MSVKARQLSPDRTEEEKPGLGSCCLTVREEELRGGGVGARGYCQGHSFQRNCHPLAHTESRLQVNFFLKLTLNSYSAANQGRRPLMSFSYSSYLSVSAKDSMS